jgi:hypothetical protein|tara:strand:+ start:2405 stop:2530 length:126 start_codon:yes stop_codon:yes gene_type:complete
MKYTSAGYIGHNNSKTIVIAAERRKQRFADAPDTVESGRVY